MCGKICWLKIEFSSAGKWHLTCLKPEERNQKSGWMPHSMAIMPNVIFAKPWWWVKEEIPPILLLTFWDIIILAQPSRLTVTLTRSHRVPMAMQVVSIMIHDDLTPSGLDLHVKLSSFKQKNLIICLVENDCRAPCAIAVANKLPKCGLYLPQCATFFSSSSSCVHSQVSWVLQLWSQLHWANE